MTYPTLRFSAALVVVAGAVAHAACTSDSSSSSATSSGAGVSDPGSPPLAPADCSSRCASKLSACGATTAQASNLCAGVCGKSPTDAQMTCMEGASCTKGTSEAERECGVQKPSSSSSGSPSPSPSPSSPTKTECVDPSGQVRAGYERYVCDCQDGIEFRSCAADPGDACRVFCNGKCKTTCKPE